jgi:hypothetical protein
MAASYPSSAKSWTPVVDATDTIVADHINDAYEEIIAIETDLLDAKSTLADNLVAMGTTALATDSLSTLVGDVLTIPAFQYLSDWPDVRDAGADSIELVFADVGTHTAAFKVTTSAGQYTADSGGTNYGGYALTNEVFSGQGQYKLLAASTGISAQDPA